MSLEIFFALFLFAGALVCTPGPANILLMSFGAKVGWRASLPLVFGVIFGKSLVHLVLSLGLWKVIQQFPQILEILKIIGFCYILWLAYKILQIKIQKTNEIKPLSFWAGIWVHPLNPKAWVMVISAYGQFIVVSQNWWWQTFFIYCVFLFWQFIAQNFWCWLGEKTMQSIIDPRLEKWFLYMLAFLMVGSSLWAIISSSI